MNSLAINLVITECLHIPYELINQSKSPNCTVSENVDLKPQPIG